MLYALPVDDDREPDPDELYSVCCGWGCAGARCCGSKSSGDSMSVKSSWAERCSNSSCAGGEVNTDGIGLGAISGANGLEAGRGAGGSLANDEVEADWLL